MVIKKDISQVQMMDFLRSLGSILEDEASMAIWEQAIHVANATGTPREVCEWVLVKLGESISHESGFSDAVPGRNRQDTRS